MSSLRQRRCTIGVLLLAIACAYWLHKDELRGSWWRTQSEQQQQRQQADRDGSGGGSGSAPLATAFACVLLHCYRAQGHAVDDQQEQAQRHRHSYSSELAFAFLDSEGRLRTRAVRAACGFDAEVRGRADVGVVTWTRIGVRTESEPRVTQRVGKFVPVTAVRHNDTETDEAERLYLQSFREFLALSAPADDNGEIELAPVSRIHLEAHVAELDDRVAAESLDGCLQSEQGCPAPLLPRHIGAQCDGRHEHPRPPAAPIEGTRWRCSSVHSECDNEDYCDEHYTALRDADKLGGKQFYPIPRPELSPKALWAPTAVELALNAMSNWGSAPFLGVLRAGAGAAREVQYRPDAFDAWLSETTEHRREQGHYHPSARLRQYEWTSFSVLRSQVLALSSSLRRVVPRRRMLGLFAPNCAEWVVADFAALVAAIPTVAVHATYSLDTLEQIVRATRMVAVLVNGEAQLEQLLLVRQRWVDAPGPGTHSSEKFPLRFIIAVDGSSLPESIQTRVRLAGMRLLDYSRFAALSTSACASASASGTATATSSAPALREPIIRREAEELATVIYTSGSTGVPRGSVISERLVHAELGLPFGLHFVELLETHAMPLAWATGRDRVWHGLMQGGRVALYTGRPAALMREFKATAPVKLLAAPLLWAELYSMYRAFMRDRDREMLATAHTSGAITELNTEPQATLMDDDEDGERARKHVSGGGEAPDSDGAAAQVPAAAVDERAPTDGTVCTTPNCRANLTAPDADAALPVGGEVPQPPQEQAQEPEPEPDSVDDAFPHMLAFRATHPLGPRLRVAVIGGAASSAELRAFLQAFLRDEQIYVHSYGTTEAGGLLTDGVVWPEVQFRLLPVPSLGYTATGLQPEGELAVKTDSMIPGYFGSGAETAAGSESGAAAERDDRWTADGYFRTGDVVRQVDERELVLIDRAASFFKTAGGEFLSPETLEEVYLRSGLLRGTLAYASPDLPGVVAIVVPDRTALAAALRDAARRAGMDDPDAIEAFEQIAQQLATSDESLLPDSSVYELLHSPTVESLLRADIWLQCRAAGLPPRHFPLAVIVAAEGFTVANGMLTPSGKVARRQIAQHFLPRIQRAYEERNREPTKLREDDGAHLDGTELPGAHSSPAPTSPTEASPPTPAEIVPPSVLSAAPASSTATGKVASILSRVLSVNLESLSSTMDVSSLGLSSLSATLLSASLSRELGAEVPVAELLSHGAGGALTLEGLARLVESRSAGPPGAAPHADQREQAREHEQEQQRAAAAQLTQQILSDLALPLDAPPLDPEPTALQQLYELHALHPSYGPVVNPASGRHTLLTGCTGFLGAQMLVELLAEPRAFVHCLVRPPERNPTKASASGVDPAVQLRVRVRATQARLDGALRRRQLLSAGFSERILVYPSVLEQPLMGLPARTYAALATSVHAVHHAAAAVDWIRSYAALRESNVVATQQLLRFAAAAANVRGTIVPVVHVSTLGVASSDKPLMERFDGGMQSDSTSGVPDEHSVQRAVRSYEGNGYNLSKWAAEWLVYRLAQMQSTPSQGSTASPSPRSVTPFTIVRPAFIGPHSRTGDSGERDFLTRLVQSVLQMKRFVRSARTLEWTPVDLVARAIIRSHPDESGTGSADQSGRGSDSLVSVLHLSSTHSRALLSYIELGVAVASVFPADDPDRPLATSPAEFVEAVRRAPDSALYPLLSVIAQPRFFGGSGEGDGDQAERDSSEEWAGRMRAVRLVAERLLVEMRPVEC